MLTEIRKLRNAANLTQNAVAARLGITQAQYSRLETGLVSLKVSTLLKLSMIIGFDASRLVREAQALAEAQQAVAEAA